MSDNILKIDAYLNSMSLSIETLKTAKSIYLSLKRELNEHGHYIDRPNCTYTLDELNYAIKLCNLKIKLIKNN